MSIIPTNYTNHAEAMTFASALRHYKALLTMDRLLNTMQKDQEATVLPEVRNQVDIALDSLMGSPVRYRG